MEMDRKHKAHYGLLPGLQRYLEEPDSLFHIVNFEAVAAEPEAFLDIYDFLIVDEVHYIKGRTSARTKALKRVASTIPRLGMTGTPVAKRPVGCLEFVQALSIRTFSRTDIRTSKNVSPSKRWWEARAGSSPSLLGGSQKELSGSTGIFINGPSTSKQRSVWLPEKISKGRYLSSCRSGKVLQRTEKDLVAEIGEMGQRGYRFVESPNSLAVISKLRQVASGFVGIPDEDNPSKTIYHSLDDFKFKAAVDLLKDLEGHQVILWYWHSYVRDKLIAYIKQEFKGSPHGHRREASSQGEGEANSPVPTRGIQVCCLECAGVRGGNTATAADVAIYVENSFSYKDRNQSEGRIYRKKGKRTQRYLLILSQRGRWIFES